MPIGFAQQRTSGILRSAHREIDWTHPLARGLVMYFDGRTRANLVRAFPGYHSLGSAAVMSEQQSWLGSTLEYVGTAAGFGPVGPALNAPHGNFSGMCYAMCDASDGTFLGRRTDAACDFHYISNAGVIQFRVGSAALVSTGISNVTSAVRYNGFSCPPAVSGAINGVRVFAETTSATVNPGTTSMQAPAIPITIGGRVTTWPTPTFTWGQGIHIHRAAVWYHRTLSDAEHMWLREDPDCVLRESIQRLYFFPTAAPAQLDAEPGSYTITGGASTYTLRALMAPGSYVLSEQSATYSISGAFVAGTYTLSEQAASYALAAPTSPGLYALTGQDAAYALSAPFGTGSYSITGYDSEASLDAQIVQPVLDLESGAWLPSEGAVLAAVLDDQSESDYAYTETLSAFEVALGPMTDPLVHDNHVIEYRIEGDGATDMVVSLKQGATVIESWTHSPAPVGFTTYSQILDEAVAATISNYADLRLRFEAA